MSICSSIPQETFSVFFLPFFFLSIFLRFVVSDSCFRILLDTTECMHAIKTPQEKKIYNRKRRKDKRTRDCCVEITYSWFCWILPPGDILLSVISCVSARCLLFFLDLVELSHGEGYPSGVLE
ncbi:uncharacterized protein BO97DRAFT_25292 [Aspergillus homomorphus CBS 101889]|uniref:Uncharacterized protein n=1 Tax=Aspergillus homomorphus (strain CBS 101889) TaxID=1450537 RepID=A0A395I3K4_ASPHC|nr:hypothetical protein BO97DRAFT_25292 [Aspergillus homomorphus CBS 101889]RAL13768.1 hypothetical protein BO97DRAFT_25292 [Aspergillus homomorphus CBS 101889]